MNKNIITFAVALTVFAGGMSVSAPAAEAACSYPGYINSNGQCSVSYQQPNYAYNNYNTVLIQQYIAQLEMLLAQLKALQGAPTTQNGLGDVDVSTDSATDVDDEQATLRGEIDFNNEDEATVYFQWGTSASSLTRSTTQVVIEEDEDDENFTARITDLEEDETYYFRAVAKDEDGYADYGSVLSFTTDEDNNNDDNNNDDDLPEVETEDADEVDENSARISGEVDMSDFEDGYAFFVYGEDEDLIDDIASDYDTYQEVDEDGDDLQKIAVDSSVDDDFSMWAELSGLDDDTEIFYAACVAFEDEDGDDMIICGDTESFTTDEN
jgi:hypothetical protein